MKDLIELYGSKKSEIKRRLKDFGSVLKQDDEKMFAEMIFCLLTPRSKAEVCWASVQELFQDGKIYNEKSWYNKKH